MKAASNRLFVVLIALVALVLPRQARAEVSAEVSVGFEAGLAPYGEWVVVPHHGRVWRPRHVAAGWRPYFHGRWIWTDDGWFWDSDEPWGWAVYHYGRWYVDPVYGWAWVPGSVWAPAWVSWRFGGGAIGWAPLLPGFSIWWTAGYPVHYSSWVFVPTQRFVGARIDSVAFAPARTASFLSSTHLAPPRSVSGSAPRLGGPPRRFVERRIGRTIAPVRVAAASTPQAARAARREGAVSVYRPPHAALGRSTAHAAGARSAPHAATGRATSRGATDRSALHGSTARFGPHGATTRPTQRHAATAHSTLRTARGRSAPHAATTHSRPHAASARFARQPGKASGARGSPPPRSAGPRAQGRTVPQRGPPPAPRLGPQPHSSGGHVGPRPQRSARAAPSQHVKRDPDHR
jgi:hypothetical protein